jgi:RpiB/LacA/LacB family sugar-phosphate isomerase
VTARDPNIESDVRTLVRKIVDGMLAADSETPLDDGQDTPSAGVQPSESESSIRTVAIGGDHGGYPLKERIAFRLKEQGYGVTDCGTDSTEAVDYPDIAAAVARQVASGVCDVGVVIDGAGIGSSIAANKVHGVRAALCYDVSTARNAREHNHANVLTLGAGLIGDALAWQITQEFLATPYGGGRHARRVDKINELERTPVGG